MNTIHHTDSSIEPTSATVTTDGRAGGRARSTPRREPIWRVVGGSVAAGLLGAIVLTLGVFGGVRRARHLRLGPARLRRRLGDARLAVGSLHQPASAVGMGAGRQHGRRRADAARRPARRSGAQHGRVGVAPGGARARGVDVRPTPPQPRRPRPLAALPGRRLARVGSVGGMYETAVRAHDQHAYAGARHSVRRRRSPPAPQLHRNGQPHRRARERARRDIASVDSNHRTR